jgi:hypothetical protein
MDVELAHPGAGLVAEAQGVGVVVAREVDPGLRGRALGRGQGVAGGQQRVLAGVVDAIRADQRELHRVLRHVVVDRQPRRLGLVGVGVFQVVEGVGVVAGADLDVGPIVDVVAGLEQGAAGLVLEAVVVEGGADVGDLQRAGVLRLVGQAGEAAQGVDVVGLVLGLLVVVQHQRAVPAVRRLELERRRAAVGLDVAGEFVVDHGLGRGVEAVPVGLVRRRRRPRRRIVGAGVGVAFDVVVRALLVGAAEHHAEPVLVAETVGPQALDPAAPRRVLVAAQAVAAGHVVVGDVVDEGVDVELVLARPEGAVGHDVDHAADRAGVLVGGEGLVDLGLARRLAGDQRQVDPALTRAAVGDRDHADAVHRHVVEVRGDAPHGDVLALLLAIEHLHGADGGNAAERLGQGLVGQVAGVVLAQGVDDGQRAAAGGDGFLVLERGAGDDDGFDSGGFLALGDGKSAGAAGVQRHHRAVQRGHPQAGAGQQGVQGGSGLQRARNGLGAHALGQRRGGQDLQARLARELRQAVGGRLGGNVEATNFGIGA